MSAQTIDYSWMHEQISAEQYDAMPEEQCRDIEIVDGMVQISPKPTMIHQIAVRWLSDAIDRGGAPDWLTVGDIDLRLRDVPLLNRQPDIVVFDAATDIEAKLMPVSAVLAVVEVVSPGFESTDRFVKPREYATAGIPHFWRVEVFGRKLVLHTYELDLKAGSYQATGEFTGSATAYMSFPVEIDLHLGSGPAPNR